MVDTARTLAALVTLLADNSAGGISAQDLRDLLVSLQNDQGEMYISTSAELTIGTKDVWVPAEASTWTFETDPVAKDFSMGTNGRLQYDGAETRNVVVHAHMSMISPANLKTYEFALGIDGSVHTSTIIRRKIGTGADVGAAGISGIVEMTSGSYVGLMARCISDDSNVQLVLANITALGFLV